MPGFLAGSRGTHGDVHQMWPSPGLAWPLPLPLPPSAHPGGGGVAGAGPTVEGARGGDASLTLRVPGPGRAWMQGRWMGSRGQGSGVLLGGAGSVRPLDRKGPLPCLRSCLQAPGLKVGRMFGSGAGSPVWGGLRPAVTPTPGSRGAGGLSAPCDGWPWFPANSFCFRRPRGAWRAGAEPAGQRRAW